MPHTRAWSETQPPDTQAVNLGPTRFHEFREDVRERMAIDHVWNDGVGTDGFHKQVTMSELAGDPTAPSANYAILYLKDDSGTTHLFMKDNASTVRQLTGTVSGLTVPWANLSGIPALISDIEALVDPNADAYLIWDDSAGALAYQTTPIAAVAGSAYGGYVGSDGTTGNSLPSGWSASKDSTGIYTVTHNLGLSTSTDLKVTAVTVYDATNQTIANPYTFATNSFKVRTHDDDNGGGGSVRDQAFMFTAVR